MSKQEENLEGEVSFSKKDIIRVLYINGFFLALFVALYLADQKWGVLSKLVQELFKNVSWLRV